MERINNPSDDMDKKVIIVAAVIAIIVIAAAAFVLMNNGGSGDKKDDSGQTGQDAKKNLSALNTKLDDLYNQSASYRRAS